jgi:hypothetical protein
MEETSVDIVEPGKKKSNGKAEVSRIQVAEATIALVCVGRTPLMMDPMDRETIEKTLIFGDRPPKDTTTPTEDRASKKMYRNPEGKIALPSDMLFACLRGAGKKVKVGPRANITKSTGETALPAIVTIQEMYLTLKHPEVTDFDQAWTTDVRRGRLASGTTCGIVRPKFEKWGFEVTVEIDYTGLEGLTEGHIKELFRRAGHNQGLGSFRPSCGGPFGTFDVAEFVVLEQR